MCASGGRAVPRLCGSVVLVFLSVQAGVATLLHDLGLKQSAVGPFACESEILPSPSELVQAPQSGTR